MENKEKVWFQVAVIFSGCLASMCNGILLAWPSPSIPKIIADNATYNISLDEASYFPVLPPLGIIVSCTIFTKLMDVIGRKRTLLLIAIPQTLSLVLTAVARNIYVFYAARFISGIGVSCLFSVLPVYIGEVTTPKVRGTWGNLITFMIYFGQLIINVLGNYMAVSTTAYACLIFPVLFVVTFSFMPESPYFYLLRNRTRDAEHSLRRLRRTMDVGEELNKLRSAITRQVSESGTWRDLLAIQSNRKAVLAGIFLRASQQLGGISSLLVYTQYIFLKSGTDISPSVSTIIFVGLCTVLNPIGSLILDRFGKRKSYITSCFCCGVALSVEVVYFATERFYPAVDLSSVRWIPLLGMVLYISFYSYGLGIVPTLMLGELFSASIKSKALVVMNISYAILLSSVTKIFHVMDTSFGLYSPYLLFAVSCFGSTILAFYFVPETKGKTLEEIQLELKKDTST